VSASTAAARGIVQGLVDAGVAHVVLCPGSRSAPLAYALAAAEDVGALRVHVRVDERSAGFTALGLGKAGGPSAVVTTSGTAVANLLPAVWEAHHSQVPMLLLTADRPRRLRGTWANQTTPLQAGAFGEAPLAAVEVEVTDDRDLREVAARCVGLARGDGGAQSGPVHVNVGFDDPLVPDDLSWAPAPLPGGRDAGVVEYAYDGPRTGLEFTGLMTVVVAGDGTVQGAYGGSRVCSGDVPWVVEPSARAYPEGDPVLAGRLLLDLPGLGADVGRVVVVGRPTLSRPVQRLIARDDVEVVVVGTTELPGPLAPARRLEAVQVTGQHGWLARWQRAGVAARRAIDDVLDGAPLLAGLHVARAVARVHPRDDFDGPRLFVGASSIVRDLDLVLDHSRPQPPVHASRGLAGIDGSLSTAGGIALGRGAPVRALVGDLTFLHDTNGLLVGPTEERPPVQVVVANDDGGSIFGLLEHGEDRFAGVHERYFATPHGVDLASLCRAHGVPHRLVTTEAELADALATWDGGALEVVEARTDRRGARALQVEVAAAAREAALATL
jgi:2-succinyl-5-enolpyruvyl-6-hydroxy-3-cyclohexene-1-carboxylate synthase